MNILFLGRERQNRLEEIENFQMEFIGFLFYAYILVFYAVNDVGIKALCFVVATYFAEDI